MLISLDPNGMRGQIDLIAVPWLMTGEKPSAAQSGGYHWVGPDHEAWQRYPEGRTAPRPWVRIVPRPT